ncbi:hypothetical protein [Nocardiopsis dassonvillei]|nr:hypothetical protein [Nocardiopsis dassonvillei]
MKTVARRRSPRVRPFLRVWEEQQATENAQYNALLNRVRAGLEAI